MWAGRLYAPRGARLGSWNFTSAGSSYGAFLLDPGGNNVEAVHHGPARRSAASVVITAGE